MDSVNSINPIPDLIPDETFTILNEHKLLSETAIRNFQIRKKFKNLRKQKIDSGMAIETLRDEYPMLQFDTLRKIVYNVNG